MKLTFSGTWAPILIQGQTVGYVMDGKGGFEYTSAYAPEAPIFIKNVKDWTDLTVSSNGRDLSLSPSAFTRARLRFVGGPLPAWSGVEATAIADGFQEFSQRWAKLDGHTPSQLLAAQRLNRPERPLAILEMESKDLNLLYQFDPHESFSEHLSVVRPIPQATGELKGSSFAISLSRQPLGYDPHAGTVPIRFMLKSLDVDLRTANNRQADMVVKETLVPLQDGLRVLSFHLLTDITSDKERRELKIKSIEDGQGRALSFIHQGDRLAVGLPEPLKAGAAVTLTFTYGGDFLVSPRGDNYWQLGVRGSWYPEPAHLAEESYDFHGTVRTKGDWIAFMPGDTVRRVKDGEWNLVESRADKPICFATILGGKYFLDEETRDGLTIRVATYAFKGGSSIKVIKDQAFHALSYYKGFLGPYPFKEMTIIEKNEWGYGQAPPSMTYITREAFEQISHINDMQALADMVDRFGGRADIRTMDVRHVLAHELAHQYWGCLVKMPSDEDQWVTETFAEYCAALYVRDYKGQGHFNRSVARWKADANEAKDAAPIPLANNLRRKDGFEGFKMRTGLLYAKGPMLLHAIHQEVGEEVFLTWMKSLQTNFRWKFATTKRMFDLLAFITKKDYTPFYDTYFWGLSMPPTK